MKSKHKKKKRTEFSKVLLIQESILVWLTTIAFIVLAFLSIFFDFLGEFTWLAALCTALWGAYGVSQAFYYKKAMAENKKGGIRYDMLLQQQQEKEEDEDEEVYG